MNPGEGPEAGGQTTPETLDIPMLDGALEALFRQMPAPSVMALAETGLGVPMPPLVPVAPEQVIAAISSPFGLFVPADQALLVETWERVRKAKGAQAALHLRSDPQQTVMLTLIDARHRYGVFLAFVSAKIGGIANGGPAAQLFRPRQCKMWRNELSVIRKVDDAMTTILGWSRDELIGKRTLDLVDPDDQPAIIANWMELLARPGGDQRIVERYRHRDGHYIWFEFTNHNLLNDPAQGFMLTEMVDVSVRMEAAEALRASELLLRRLIEALPLGIVQIDAERRVVFRNERLSELADVTEASAIDDQFEQVAAADRPALIAALAAMLSPGTPADIELTIVHGDIPRRCSVGMRALRSASGAVTGGIIFVSDISERVLMRDELEKRATYDDLTRCYNRASIIEELNARLANPARDGTGIAVLFVDVDRFKDVNDRYGHAAGDELLRRIGERLLNSVRGSDAVGRFGGDEFLVVCPRVRSPGLALEMARRASTAISQRVAFGTSSMLPTVSIGVAWTDRAIGTDALIASADAAMYESKRSDHRPVLSPPLHGSTARIAGNDAANGKAWAAAKT
jgi:diguanylate cyclase (GGDEF)-like protein/PAS domain S-box-containing protein